MSRPIQCQISIAALQHNLQVARQHAQERPVWAVVKANAYGHGSAVAVKAFADADGLAMLDFEDALLCRALGWRKRILLLEGAFAQSDVSVAAKHQFDLVVHSPHQLLWLEKSGCAHLLTLHLKMNSGMNRLGFKPEMMALVAEQIEQKRLAKSVIWITHFANADLDPLVPEDNAVRYQTQQEVFIKAGGDLLSGSTANSAAVLASIQPVVPKKSDLEQKVGWSRPGVMLYGATPFAHKSARDLCLKAAMNFSSEIIATQDLNVGDQVGYGSRFTAAKPMRIGIVACGYADGYPRHAGSGTPVAVFAQLHTPSGAMTKAITEAVMSRTVGRVSMDMLAIDLTDIPEATIGSCVQLWGDKVPVDEVANAAGTIGYELLCAVAPRVRRSVI